MKNLIKTTVAIAVLGLAFISFTPAALSNDSMLGHCLSHKNQSVCIATAQDIEQANPGMSSINQYSLLVKLVK